MAETRTKKADPCTITLKNVTLSFANAIFEPKKPKADKDGKQGPPKYHCNGLMEKNTPQTAENLALWKAAKNAACKKKWGEDPDKWPKIKGEKQCVRDGDQEDWEGYTDNWYISASANEEDKPLLVDHARRDVAKSDGLLYSGAVVNLRVNIWAQDNEFGKRINANLLGIQFVKHGTPFGRGPVDRNEAFEDLSESSEVEPMDTDGEPI